MAVNATTVTIPLEDLDAIRTARYAAENETAELKKRLTEALQTDRTGTVKELNDLLRECFVIVRFAVANLPAETTRRWPSGSLRKLIDALPKLPDANDDDKSFAIELRTFRREIAEFDRFRATRDEDEKRLAEINTGLDEGVTANQHIDVKYGG